MRCRRRSFIFSRRPAAREFAVHGVDVSKYQGDIDWEQVKDSGVAFAFIKATEGGDKVDSKFQYNWAAAKAAGVPRGAYHFVYWCRPPHEEIANFALSCPTSPTPCRRCSMSSRRRNRRAASARSIAKRCSADMRNMLEAMERHYGKKPIIYSSVDFYQAILQPDALSEYPIWVRSTKYHPKVRYGERKWTFWQYRSDGRVPGIVGAVDQNAFRGIARRVGRSGSPRRREAEHDLGRDGIPARPLGSSDFSSVAAASAPRVGRAGAPFRLRATSSDSSESRGRSAAPSCGGFSAGGGAAGGGGAGR